MYQRSNGRQSFSFRQLFLYIRQDKGRAADIPEVAIYHNIPFEPQAIVKAFEDNDRYRRSNPHCTTTQFHDYISFHPDDTEKLTPEKLRTIMEEYIRLRTDNRALVYAQAHLHSNAVHAHFQISGTEAQGSKSMSKRKPQYKKMRRALEEFQREHFPELQKSIVLDRDGDRIHPRKQHRERAMESRTKQESQKTKYAKLLQKLWKKARDREDFFRRIRGTELIIYSRSGRPCGVQAPTGKKYRFKTLAITPVMLVELDRRVERERIAQRKRQLSQVLDKNREDRGRKREQHK